MLHDDCRNAAGSIPDGENAGSGVCTVFDLRDVAAGAQQTFSRPIRIGCAPSSAPYTIASVLILPRAMNHLDQHVRADKLHQPAVVLPIDSVKDHGKSETRAVKERRARGELLRPPEGRSR